MDDSRERRLAELEKGILEVWEWLADRHPTGAGLDAISRLAKAETCVATLAEWEEKHPEGAARFLSEVLRAQGEP